MSLSRRGRVSRARRLVLASLVTVAGAGAVAGPGVATPQPKPPQYVFETLDNAKDVTFNQLLGINQNGVIAGYFGSGAAGHSNQGYTLDPPYGQVGYVNENFPGRSRPRSPVSTIVESPLASGRT